MFPIPVIPPTYIVAEKLQQTPYNDFFEPATTFSDIFRVASIYTASILAKIALRVLSDLEFYNLDTFYRCTAERAKFATGRPLISVSNHRSVLDDPGLFSAIMTWEQLTNIEQMRWGMAMKLAAQRLRSGEWVHIFPEGRVMQFPQLGRFKWGVGMLVDEAAHLNPQILPFVTSGMDKIFDEARGKRDRYIPQFGKRLRGMFGDPFDCQDVVDRFDELSRNNPGWGDPWPPHREELYSAVTRKIEYRLTDLWTRLQAMNAAEQSADDRGVAFDAKEWLRRDRLEHASNNPEPALAPPGYTPVIVTTQPKSSSWWSRASTVSQPDTTSSPTTLNMAQWMQSRTSLQLFYPPAPPGLEVLPEVFRIPWRERIRARLHNWQAAAGKRLASSAIRLQRARIAAGVDAKHAEALAVAWEKPLKQCDNFERFCAIATSVKRVAADTRSIK